MKKLRLFQIIVIAATASTAANASDDFFSPAQSAASHGLFAGINTAETDAGRDDSQSQPPVGLDRRDRIFYPGDTERPKPLLRKLFLNILYDQQDIFTSPFHVNRHNALEWLVPMAATGALIASDTHIANAFENSRGQVRWGGRISNIGASYTLIPIVAGSYVYGAWRDSPKAREIGVLGTESLLDSLIVVAPMKRTPGTFGVAEHRFPPATRSKSGRSLHCWHMNTSTKKLSRSAHTA